VFDAIHTFGDWFERIWFASRAVEPTGWTAFLRALTTLNRQHHAKPAFFFPDRFPANGA
jgi:hypothetical protein